MPRSIKSNFNVQIAKISQEQWTAKQCLIGEFSWKEKWFNHATKHKNTAKESFI